MIELARQMARTRSTARLYYMRNAILRAAARDNVFNPEVDNKRLIVLTAIETELKYRNANPRSAANSNPTVSNR